MFVCLYVCLFYKASNEAVYSVYCFLRSSSGLLHLSTAQLTEERQEQERDHQIWLYGGTSFISVGFAFCFILSVCVNKEKHSGWFIFFILLCHCSFNSFTASWWIIKSIWVDLRHDLITKPFNMTRLLFDYFLITGAHISLSALVSAM